jgi:dienelactone hydrolase
MPHLPVIARSVATKQSPTHAAPSHRPAACSFAAFLSAPLTTASNTGDVSRRKRLIVPFLLALTTALATPPATAGTLTVSIPVTPVPGSHQPDRPYDATLTLPSGAGRFPAVILLHGCGGEGPSQQFWIDRLTGWGYAVLRLDSFSARGITSVCAPQSQNLATPVDRSGDVLSAALWLRTRPEIDGARIGVLGESHGGGTAAAVTSREYERLYPGLLRASVDYFGPCRDPKQHGTVPLLALAGDADTWGYSARACQAFAAALQPDQPMQVEVYPGAVHDFENPSAVHLRYILGHPAQYDSSAANDSYAKVKAFLARYLGGAS